MLGRREKVILSGSEEIRTYRDGSTGPRDFLALNWTKGPASRISRPVMLASRLLPATVSPRLAIAVLAAAGALLVEVSQASARTAFKPPPVVRGSTYLALGDSLTFGHVEPTVVPAPNYSDPSSFVGYPEIVGRLLRLKVVNAACPGETSPSLINSSALSNTCNATPTGTNGYRTLYPLHVSYSGSQLSFAVKYLKKHRNVRLVSLMIGANDFFLCEKMTTDSCLSPSEYQPVSTTLSGNVRTILSTIRKKARYRGQIVLVNYYSLNYASPPLNNVIVAGNAALDTAAKPYNVRIADGYGIFQSATSIFGGNPCTAGLLTKLSTGGCGVHATVAGQGLLAQAVVYALRF